MAKKKMMLLGILIVAGVLVAVRYFMQSAQLTKAPVQPAGTSDNTTDSTAKEANIVTSYNNPAGGDQVGFTVVVDKEGVITDVQTQVLATHDVSKMRQQSFATAAPAVLRGKKLSELTAIDRVGGSSLTTGAFNASIEKLKAEF